MAETSTNMQLTRWTSGTDKFDYKQLAENFRIIDAHDHGASGGVQISSAGIATDAIQSSHIAPGAVTAAKIDTGAITSSSIGTNQIGNTQLDLTNVNEARTTIPTGTIEDGYTFDYTNSTLSFTWRLRYVEKAGLNSGTATWMFVGGSAKSAETNASVQLDNNTYTLLSGTSVTIPATGKYEVTFGGNVNIFVGANQSTAIAYLGCGISTSPTSEILNSAPSLPSETNLGFSLSRTFTSTFAANDTLDLYGKATNTGLTNNGDSQVTRRFIHVKPIYIGT